MLERRAETGPEEEVEHVAPIGLGIVMEQAGGRAGADCPDALERQACVGALQPDAYRLGGADARRGCCDYAQNNR